MKVKTPTKKIGARPMGNGVVMMNCVLTSTCETLRI